MGTPAGNPKGAVASSDPLATETLVTLCGESILPEDLRGAAPVLCADRRAWFALEAGDFERGRRLLALAPTNSQGLTLRQVAELRTKVCRDSVTSCF